MPTKTQESTPIKAPTSLEKMAIDQFFRAINNSIRGGVNPIEIDCGALREIRSSHVGLLWQAYEICRENSTKMRLISVSTGLARVLSILDLNEVLLINEVIENSIVCNHNKITPHYQETELNLNITPNITAIDEAMNNFVRFLMLNKLPEITAFELQTIFYEVATNIRCHSKLVIGELISFHVELHEHFVILIFRDRGESFDPTSLPPADDITIPARHGRINGYGLTMINRLCDKISYNRTSEELNELTIRKSWGARND